MRALSELKPASWVVRLGGLVCAAIASGCATTAPVPIHTENVITDENGQTLVVFVTPGARDRPVEEEIQVVPSDRVAAADYATEPLRDRFEAAREQLCDERAARSGPARERCLDYALTVAMADPDHAFVQDALGGRPQPAPRPTTQVLAGGPEPAAAAVAIGPVAPARTAQGGGAYVVRSGDSLWAIAERVYGDGRYADALFEANRDVLSAPDHIVPGQTLALPPLSS